MSSERMNERFDLGEGIARQELNVIFVIDNSGSMQGEKIGAVNNAMRNMRWECGFLKRKARSFGFSPLQNKDLLWQ